MKILVALFLVYLTLFSLSFPVHVTGKETDLKFSGKNISAKLKEVPLKDVLWELEKQKGIRWKVYSDIGECKMTAQFTGMLLEKAVKRMLSPMNYVLFFDADGKLVRILIIGEKGTGQFGSNSKMVSLSNRGPIPMHMGISTATLSRQVERNRRFSDELEEGPADNNSVLINSRKAVGLGGTEGPQSKKGVKSAGAFRPGSKGIIEKGIIESPEKMQHAKYSIKIPEPTAEQMKGFNVQKNLPAPGGTVRPSQEILQSFEVQRNLPAPGT